MIRVSRLSHVLFPAALLALLSVSGCSCSSTPGAPADGGGSDGSTVDGGVIDGAVQDGALDDGAVVVTDSNVDLVDGGVVVVDAGDGGTTECFVKICVDAQGRQINAQCGDCLDNDMDGLADDLDPECLNFCDDHEATFSFFDPSSGGGDTPSCSLDCYYDPDVGSGNDGCRWNGRCDPLEPDPLCASRPSLVGGNQCPLVQAPECAERCGRVVPNGCDCFGCCELPAGGGNFVFIGTGAPERNPTCTLAAATAGDTTACAPCTPRLGDDNCYNSCGPCELCLGRTVDDLPCECFGGGATVPPRCEPQMMDGGVPDAGPTPDGGTPSQCAGDLQPCGLPGQAACPTNAFCLTGCCVSFG